ncbi:MAG: hypothetical protein RBT63_04420 [Bdellovibrionales bacterium]|jgi:hypothetical protein|nr:hypothetical protein [Bdellovibrionales bacterium]
MKSIKGILLSGFVVLLALGSDAFAHGEDAPGPHGGEIRMPGAFHTELKQAGREFEVYLLDMQFKDATVRDGSVELNIERAASGGKVSKFSFACNPMLGKAPHFHCISTDTGYKPVDGDRLLLKARRGRAVGTVAEYKLPLLSAGGSATQRHDHGAHGHHDHGGSKVKSGAESGTKSGKKQGADSKNEKHDHSHH